VTLRNLKAIDTDAVWTRAGKLFTDKCAEADQ